MHANLVLFTKGGNQRTIPLSSEITIIGRRHDCDLRIPLKPISRRHCQLKIRDLDSSGGTFLNGKKVNEGVVHAGDYIRIGPLTFQLQIDGKPEKASLPTKQTAPKQAAVKAQQAQKEQKPALDSSDSFADLDLSDSFISELEDL